MDLTVIHQNPDNGGGGHFGENYGSEIHKFKETIQETDCKRNNNLFNSSKTETNNDLGHDPSSLFQDVTYISKESLKVENTIFSYSSFQRAMDLTMHSRSNGETKRTIFEDADFFSKNYMYKLLPITFENVDEAIIHTEHNYCHASLSSESEAEEDCSRTMDYSQIKEKNYKKRKAKNDQGADEDMLENGDSHNVSTLPITFPSPNINVCEADPIESNPLHPEENSTSQPLDLSAPLVQENKTDLCLRLHDSSIVNSNEKEDVGEFDSDKENQKSNIRCIEVTITRPDEKENYEPCDLFLNDMARLVPKLIKKDCFQIDILDRTCDRGADKQNHRLYYIISERTWQLFQTAKERVILTNDQSLGQPVQKMEENEKPTFLIFDQVSLAKYLADYCKEIGGYFEYTCVEEGKDGGKLDEVELEKEVKSDEHEKEKSEEVTEEKTDSMEEKKSDEIQEKKSDEIQERKSNEIQEKKSNDLQEKKSDEIQEKKSDEIQDKFKSDEIKEKKLDEIREVKLETEKKDEEAVIDVNKNEKTETYIREEVKSHELPVEDKKVEKEKKQHKDKDCKETKTAKRKSSRREELRPNKVIKTEAGSSVSKKEPAKTKKPTEIKEDSKKTTQDTTKPEVVREIKTRSKSVPQPETKNVKRKTSQKSKEVKATKRKSETKSVESPKKQKPNTVSVSVPETISERKTRSGKTLDEKPPKLVEAVKETKQKEDASKKEDVKKIVPEKEVVIRKPETRQSALNSVRKLRSSTNPQNSPVAQKVNTHKTVPKTAPKGRKR